MKYLGKVCVLLILAGVIAGANEMAIVDGEWVVAAGCFSFALVFLLVSQFYQLMKAVYAAIPLGFLSLWALWDTPNLYWLGWLAAVIAVSAMVFAWGHAIRETDGEE